MKYKIEINSAIPGIDHRKYPDYKKEIIANSINEAAEKYQQQMKDILPTKTRYELLVKDSNGNSEIVVLEKK